MKNSNVIITILVIIIIFIPVTWMIKKNKLNQADISDAVETTPVSTASPSNILEPEKVSYPSDNPNNRRSFYSFFDGFPYDNMIFIDDAAFETIKEAYSILDFDSKFNCEDVEKYEFYMEKYKLLLDSKEEFIQKNTNDKYILNEYPTFRPKLDGFELKELELYLFDVDEDGALELYTFSPYSGVHVFKYQSDTDEFFIWYEGPNGYYSLLGSKTVVWNRGGQSRVFYKLDNNGDEEFSVSFNFIEGHNNTLNQDEFYYMVSLPVYAGETKKNDMSDALLAQAYYNGLYDEYCFRVTESQYRELTQMFHDVESRAIDKLGDMKMYYVEMFGVESK